MTVLITGVQNREVDLPTKGYSPLGTKEKKMLPEDGAHDTRYLGKEGSVARSPAWKAGTNQPWKLAHPKRDREASG